jgi:hypothetical protein
VRVAVGSALPSPYVSARTIREAASSKAAASTTSKPSFGVPPAVRNASTICSVTLRSIAASSTGASTPVALVRRPGIIDIGSSTSFRSGASAFTLCAASAATSVVRAEVDAFTDVVFFPPGPLVVTSSVAVASRT